MTHLHLDLLATGWSILFANLKLRGVKRNIRIDSNYKSIIKDPKNQLLDEWVRIKKCYEPPSNLKEIYELIGFRHEPFGKQKICCTLTSARKKTNRKKTVSYGRLAATLAGSQKIIIQK